VSRLTIIIPAFGRQEDLDDTLVSVLENRPPDCEVLVPHGPAYRDPYDLSDEIRFVPTRRQELISLIRAGLGASQTPLVHFLQCGFRATPAWTDPVIQRFAADVSLAAIAPRVQLTSERKMDALRGIRYHRGGTRRDVRIAEPSSSRSHASNLWEGPSLQAGFFRRCALDSIGGLDPHLGTFYCDVDAIVKLRRAGWRFDHESDSLIVGPETHRPRGFRIGREAEWLFWRHWRALGRVASLRDHAWITAIESLQSFPRVASFTTICGRFFGLLECAVARRHRWIPTPSDESGCRESESQDPLTISIDRARRRKPARPKLGPSSQASRGVGS
jgi:hypothetical protein